MSNNAGSSLARLVRLFTKSYTVLSVRHIFADIAVLGPLLPKFVSMVPLFRAAADAPSLVSGSHGALQNFELDVLQSFPGKELKLFPRELRGQLNSRNRAEMPPSLTRIPLNELTTLART